MRKPDKTLDRFWDLPRAALLELLEATPAGLTSAEAKQRLRLHGPNSVAKESRFAPLLAFLRFFAHPVGIKSPLDDAILKYQRQVIVEYEKVDEIPFDFNRKRLSVIVRRGGEHLLITKGEAESVFAICGTVIIDGDPQPFDEGRRAEAAATFQKFSADGFRTLGVAVRKVEQQDAHTLAAERDMTLAGFAAFLDPP